MRSLDTCNERAPEKLTGKRISGSLKRESLLPRVSEHSKDAENTEETTSDSVESSPCPRGTVNGTAENSTPQSARKDDERQVQTSMVERNMLI